MAAITPAEIATLRGSLQTIDEPTSGHGPVGALRIAPITVIVAIPDATSDATADVLFIKDPTPGDEPNTVSGEPANAKNGWKAYSYADAVLAYGT